MRYLWILVLVAVWGPSLAQRQGQHNNRSGNDRIEQLKIAKLTSDMRLTKDQAEKFWPIYNNFDEQRIKIRREIRQLSRSITIDDDAVAKQNKIQGLKQKELDLIKKFKSEFLKVISEQQYAIMATSEERFNQALLQQLKERNHEEE